jgi:hypothetical protein
MLQAKRNAATSIPSYAKLFALLMFILALTCSMLSRQSRDHVAAEVTQNERNNNPNP